MFDIVKEKGHFEEKEMGSHVGFYYKPVLKFSIGKLKPVDVKRAYKLAVRKFYMNPRKILSILSTIRSIREFKWVFQFFILSQLNIFKDIIGKS